MSLRHDIQSIGSHFKIAGKFLHAKAHEAGHINDTYIATYALDGVAVSYVHQRINHEVFQQPLQLMENIQRITTHQSHHLQQNQVEDWARRCLVLVEAHKGRPYFQDQEGNTWRTYRFIDHAQTHNIVTSPALAYEAAKAFGNFQKILLDLPGPALHETIVGFHNTLQRFQHFQEAVDADDHNRAKGCQTEIAFALKHQRLSHVLLHLQATGHLPVRAVHNDTKLNNVLIDNATQREICVIDLDTVMPGLAVYDFGGLIRTSTSPVGEDAQDLSQVTMRFSIFEALARGFLDSAGSFLTATEKDYLAFSGQVITFEDGLRFLTDHLKGDRYYKIHRKGQNLDRCRTQFKLLESIQQQEAAMTRFIEDYAPAINPV